MNDSGQSPQNSPHLSLEQILSDLEATFSDLPKEESDQKSHPQGDLSKVNKQKVMAGLTLMLVVSGSVAGFYLAQESQELRQQASTAQVIEIASPSQSEDVVTFTVVEATTKRPIQSIEENKTISFNSAQNIQISFNDSSVMSVVTTLSGPVSQISTLNTVPFELEGAALNMPSGSYTLQIAGYAQPNGNGLQLVEKTVRFTVSN